MINKSTIDLSEIAKFSRLSEHWWDKKGVLKTLHDINPARLAFLEQSVDLSGKTVLDVGCGGGILTESMANKGAKVTGIDASEEAILVAKNHAAEQNLNIKYIASPIESLEANPFDIITCMEMLEHVEEPQEVIYHCARLLKPGGYLFLSTINRSLAAYSAAIIAAEYLFRLLPRQTHDYHKFIKPSELVNMVREVDLDLVGLQGIFYNPLNGSAHLQNSVSVNYIMACYKPL